MFGDVPVPGIGSRSPSGSSSLSSSASLNVLLHPCPAQWPQMFEHTILCLLHEQFLVSHPCVQLHETISRRRPGAGLLRLVTGRKWPSSSFSNPQSVGGKEFPNQSCTCKYNLCSVNMFAKYAE